MLRIEVTGIQKDGMEAVRTLMTTISVHMKNSLVNPCVLEDVSFSEGQWNVSIQAVWSWCELSSDNWITRITPVVLLQLALTQNVMLPVKP